MNILFYTSFKVHSTKGGTERTTISVATGLTEIYGSHCFSAYIYDATTPKEKCFVAEYCVSGKNMFEQLRKIIIANNINVVIDQGDFGIVKSLRKTINDTGCKIILAHHFQPGWETHFETFNSYLNNWRKSPDILRFAKRTFKLLLYPILRFEYLHNIPHSYNQAYQYANAVVLLSKGFVKPFMKYAKLNDSKKFHIIPNSLSFTYFLPKQEIQNKNKIALIVSRLDEPQKRLSLAIRIWSEVKKHVESKDWKLNIIGHGPYLNSYKRLINRLAVPDIHLLGRQVPNDYYKESSIFMMTSKSEGWGLTLTEAQQMGVVPIAFDSYESLRDIITNGDNGIVVPECDTQKYVESLLWLMSNKQERYKLAESAIDSSHRFENGKVVTLWYKLIEELTSNTK